MTLRKLWLIVLVIACVAAIAINAIILALLTDRYFSDYLKESYELHVNQIAEYTKLTLTSQNVSYQQMSIELESHLNDPIIAIKLYEPNGKLIVAVESDYHMRPRKHRMMGRGMGASSEEVHKKNIVVDGEVIAIMNITIHSIAENSFVARRFKGALLSNSLLSIVIAIGIALVTGILVSKKMSKSLNDTEKLASDIQLGKDVSLKPTGIKEVDSIRESLMEFNVRLKLKQKNRKSLIDRLIHQTRTPLTILRSHIEAIEDGVIKVDKKELELCQNQITSITDILSNLNLMIDAEQDTEELKIEEFDFAEMLKQIEQGLLAQFKNKNIKLEIVSKNSVELITDKYKLSQALYNLLTNAYKYTPENEVVRVSYITMNDRLTVRVQDTGMGISEEEKGKIFNAYYRSPRAEIKKGDGLGLYIVRENIGKLGGSVALESSQLNTGSTFSITIPININSVIDRE